MDFKDISDFLDQTNDMTPIQVGKQMYGLSDEEVAKTLSLQFSQNLKTPTPGEQATENNQEQKNMSTTLPLAVAKQEKDAEKYFTKNNETNHLTIIKQVQQLRKQGLIQYKNTGGDSYEVIFSGSKIKWYMSADTSIADSTGNYNNRDGSDFKPQETTKSKLQSPEGKNYLQEKITKEKKKLMNKENFLKLGKSLYPTGSEQEQILAIMLATGFYGYMRLSNIGSNYQLAVRCYRGSANRGFIKMSTANVICSIVYTADL